MSLWRLKVTVGEPASPNPNVDGDDTIKAKRQTVVLGNESEVVFIPRLISFDQAWKWFDYLDTQIAWTRPTIRVFGRSCLQVSLSLSISLLCFVSKYAFFLLSIMLSWYCGLFNSCCQMINVGIYDGLQYGGNAVWKLG